MAELAVPRVLIVDDDPNLRRMLHDLLSDCGLSVVGQAGDGLEALAAANRLLPDVVVMDLRMPGMGGIEATERLTATLPSARVVLYTAFDDAVLRRRATEAGAFATVVKGQHPSRLMQAIWDAWSSIGLPDRRSGTAGRPAGDW